MLRASAYGAAVNGLLFLLGIAAIVALIGNDQWAAAVTVTLGVIAALFWVNQRVVKYAQEQVRAASSPVART